MVNPGSSSRTFRTLAVAVVTCFAMGLGACAGSSDRSGGGAGTGDARRDLEALQGKWEQLPEEPGPGSPRQRVLKEVTGNTEVVTTYDANGGPVRSQTATFRLSRPGGVPVYTFSGARVTAGAGEDADRPETGPRSYLYRVRGDDYYEVWGLLPGQEEREVVVRHWKRVKPGGR